MPTSPMRQTHFQWFEDDAPPASNSPLRGEDSNLAAVAAGSHVLLRVQCQHVGIHTFSVARRLEYRKTGSNVWRAVGSFAVPPYDAPLFYPSTWFVDGDEITTQRLSTPPLATEGNFKGGEAKQADNPTGEIVYGPKDFSEDVFSVWIHPQAPAGIDLEFRVTREGQPLEYYALYRA